MSNEEAKHLKVVMPEGQPEAAVGPIAKPGKFSLNKFKSKHASTIANVETLQTGLPYHRISEAKDFIRLHPSEETYWSDELCFANVPIQGMKRDTLHLIDEDLALRYLPSGRILRFRLALATKPFDVFFLCHLPTRNPDNSWNASVMKAAEQSKTRWVQVSSQRDRGIDEYKVDFARNDDAFPAPKWPTQSLDELIERAFEGRMIDHDNHPALLRLIGAKQSLS